MLCSKEIPQQRQPALPSPLKFSLTRPLSGRVGGAVELEMGVQSAMVVGIATGYQ